MSDYVMNFDVILTIWHRERLWLTSFSKDKISINSLPSKAFILSCLLANLKADDKCHSLFHEPPEGSVCT